MKLAGQIVITGIFAWYVLNSGEVGTDMLIPFTGGFEDGKFLSLGILFVPALFFVTLGTDNGVNFTDGLDGLCTSVTILVATFLTIVAIGEDMGISPITGAVVGSLLGFLLFNVYPAKVFMGDTGSLALGGFVASAAYMMRLPLFIPIIGLIYLVEVLSVIIQVTILKRQGGKRIFKMAPIHHHFELCGWSETRVEPYFPLLRPFYAWSLIWDCKSAGSLGKEGGLTTNGSKSESISCGNRQKRIAAAKLDS